MQARSELFTLHPPSCPQKPSSLAIARHCSCARLNAARRSRGTSQTIHFSSMNKNNNVKCVLANSTGVTQLAQKKSAAENGVGEGAVFGVPPNCGSIACHNTTAHPEDP